MISDDIQQISQILPIFVAMQEKYPKEDRDGMLLNEVIETLKEILTNWTNCWNDIASSGEVGSLDPRNPEYIPACRDGR